MRIDWRVRLLAGGLLVPAVPVVLFVPEPLGGVLALGLAVTGLFLYVVVAQRAVPADGAEALLAGGELAQVRTGLGLQGRPVYVHDQGNVGEERMFLPSDDAPRQVPVLDPETVVYGSGGRVGIAVRPSGLVGLQAHERATAPLEGGLQEADAFLRGMLQAHDLGRGFRLTEAKGGYRARFLAGAARPPCLDEPETPACEAAGCHVCQAVGCALARAVGRPVLLEGADVEGEQVRLRFKEEP